MAHFTKSLSEGTTLEWSKNLGYTIFFGNDIASEGSLAGVQERLSQPRLMMGEVRVKDVEKES